MNDATLILENARKEVSYASKDITTDPAWEVLYRAQEHVRNTTMQSGQWSSVASLRKSSGWKPSMQIQYPNLRAKVNRKQAIYGLKF